MPSARTGLASGVGGTTVTVAPQITVEGGSRGDEADGKLAKQISREIEIMTRKVRYRRDASTNETRRNALLSRVRIFLNFFAKTRWGSAILMIAHGEDKWTTT